LALILLVFVVVNLPPIYGKNPSKVADYKEGWDAYLKVLSSDSPDDAEVSGKAGICDKVLDFFQNLYCGIGKSTDDLTNIFKLLYWLVLKVVYAVATPIALMTVFFLISTQITVVIPFLSIFLIGCMTYSLLPTV